MTEQMISFQFLTMGRDTLPQTKLLKVHLSLNTSQYFFWCVYSQPTLFQCKAISPCLITTCLCKKSLSSSLVGHLQILEGAVISQWSLLFCSLKNFSSFRLSSEDRCSRLIVIFEALLWIRSNRSPYSHFESPRAGHKYSKGLQVCFRKEEFILYSLFLSIYEGLKM